MWGRSGQRCWLRAVHSAPRSLIWGHVPWYPRTRSATGRNASNLLRCSKLLTLDYLPFLPTQILKSPISPRSMSSSSSPPPPPPFVAQNPSAPGQGSGGALPAAFSNFQISPAPPRPGAPRGLTPQPAPPAAFAARPSDIRAEAPPSAGPFPGSPPAPPLPFVRAPTASAAQPGPPFDGPPEAAVSQPPPFGGPPGAVSQPPPPFGGPPRAVSQLPRPFGGLPAAVSQAYPPFGGPAGAVSQAPRFVAPPGAVSQPPPFGGPPAVGSQPAPPLFGGPRPAFSGPPSATGVASSQAMLPSFGAQQQPAPPFGGPPQFGGPRPGVQPPFSAQSAPGSQQPPFMEMPRANAPVFGPPSWQSEVLEALS